MVMVELWASASAETETVWGACQLSWVKVRALSLSMPASDRTAPSWPDRVTVTSPDGRDPRTAV